MADLLLIVRLAGQRVAIPAIHVESVVEIEALTPVPRTAPHIAGLAALRSRVLTVIDCRAALDLEPSEGPPSREAIVIAVDGHPYALLVDTVDDVLEYSGEVRPIKTALEPGWRRVAEGMVEAAGDLYLLIDAHALLSGPIAQAA